MAKEQEYLIWYKFRVRPDFSRLGQSDKKKRKERNACFKFSSKFNKPLYKKSCSRVFFAGIN